MRKTKITNRRLKMIIREELIRQASQPGILLENDLSSLVGSKGKQGAKDLANLYPDAMKIYTSLKGLGTDEEGIREVLNRRQADMPRLYTQIF
jgi:hypothetical protein